MARTHVDYDQIAVTYNERYTVRNMERVAAALRCLVQSAGARRILEVGCGTGHWLAELRPIAHQVVGLDLSLGMLGQARQRRMPLELVCGQATALPFPEAGFDLLFCVNAFHHFGDQRAFLAEARRLLRPGGALATIGINPHTGPTQWYLYRYFEGTYETDLRRYPSPGTILDWMVETGFARVEWQVAERILHPLVGREVLNDPFLRKNSTSQLALLSDEAYAVGLRRIEAALAEAEAGGKRLVFPVDIPLAMVTGYV